MTPASRKRFFAQMNKELRVIHDDNEKQEQIQIDEAEKGQGHSPKAMNALKQFQANEEKISFVRFHKYGHLK